jgi:hypothetical protein
LVTVAVRVSAWSESDACTWTPVAPEFVPTMVAWSTFRSAVSATLLFPTERTAV